MNNFSIKAPDRVIEKAFALLSTFGGTTKGEQLEALLESVAETQAAYDFAAQGRFADRLTHIARAAKTLVQDCNSLAADANLQIDNEHDAGLRAMSEMRKNNEDLQTKCRDIEAENVQLRQKLADHQAKETELEARLTVANEQIATLTASLRNYESLSTQYDQILGKIMHRGEPDQTATKV